PQMRARHIVATVCAAGLIATACGSDDSSSDDTSPAETDASAGTDAPADAGDGGADWPDKLVFTLTPSQETGGLIETAQPLADLLAEQLGVEVEALVPTDYAGVIVALESGQAQIAGGLGPRQMVQAEDQAGAELILQSERFGSLLYVTQWYTNDPDTYCADEPVADEDGFLFCNGVLDAAGPEDGPIAADQLSKLEGQTVAFVDQGSTSGYAIPALQLSEAGIDPIDGVDALFAGGHDTAVQAVYDGDATVGVSFNDARGQLVEAVPDVGEKVVVFGWSGPIPNDGFAVAGDLPQDLVDAIKAAFIEIASTEEGAALLDELYEIDGLVAVTSSDYDVIRNLEDELGDVLS
ncbi:MAG: phosphate/phosphite/phosphonate ABC transporter substrate-binding protein, partial [Acidimicrobiia bacterium]|nr:phosphate/phosphite/phosphonate ABC transporter substrate-binding protein [Acidimicrobiia bacterium]